MKLNERAWAGHVISWIKSAIDEGTTIFEEATNDEGLKVASGRTKFPDVLLFTDKRAGVVFNGWELKLPDTPVDDPEMLNNALEKAAALRADSFVTWNGSATVIWKIETSEGEAPRAVRLKLYPPIPQIQTRADIAERAQYVQHEPLLRARLTELLRDLDELYRDGTLSEAVNISEDIVTAVHACSQVAIPALQSMIRDRQGKRSFRRAFEVWKAREQATLAILANSSRKKVTVVPEHVLAKLTFYQIVSRIIFYQTLAVNMSGRLYPIAIDDPDKVQSVLTARYAAAAEIDYAAVFERDFMDELAFSERLSGALFQLLEELGKYDMRVLPSTVIGTVLENLVPSFERLQLGQYFTPALLAELVVLGAVHDDTDVVFDPTSGTGVLLDATYRSLSAFRARPHRELLSQVWGNDISHFPAVLSVINLYKQQVTDTTNFPRVLRRDFFSLMPGMEVEFPDSEDTHRRSTLKIPQFDAIVSNFPFIQQEDIPSKELTDQFRKEFERGQQAFLDGSDFKINERSDYYIYCFYHAFKFLKPGGRIAAITSNAWLGKEYGAQFKQFLLDNFTIKYVVRSTEEHWFQDSKVSTIYLVAEKGATDTPTKFVTLHAKLEDYLAESFEERLPQIEGWYEQIDNCTEAGDVWESNDVFEGVYHAEILQTTVSVVSRERLEVVSDNWSTYFVAESPLGILDRVLVSPYDDIFDAGRGTRTGQDAFHILKTDDADERGINPRFLKPTLKSPKYVTKIRHSNRPSHWLFVCDVAPEVLQVEYPDTWAWIESFADRPNKIGKPLRKVFERRQPYWYTLSPEEPANIFIAINPGDRLFFAYTDEPIQLNQRLAALRVPASRVKLIAALLNSVVSLLIVELNGTSRNLGALDLNANFFKSKIKMLDPERLSTEQAEAIVDAFEPLCVRTILPIAEELQQEDRQAFDKVVLEAYGYDDAVRQQLYNLLAEVATLRIGMWGR